MNSGMPTTLVADHGDLGRGAASVTYSSETIAVVGK
jgi:hypothetical protein